MREKLNISEDLLRTCLFDQYSLAVTTLDFLPLGLDFKAGVYQVVDEQGISYLLKVRSGTLYKPGCLIPDYLREKGITEVVAPLPNKNGTLWTEIGEWTVIVYPFIVGDTSWTGMTDEQWKATGAIFKQIHQVPLPVPHIASLRKETFDAKKYADRLDALEAQYIHLPHEESTVKRAICISWIEHQKVIYTVAASLEQLAKVLQEQNLPYVICHADLHSGNLLRDQASYVHVLDWDEVMLAPKERDFIFVEEPAASAKSGPSSFYQGYGQLEIDWFALTYYRYERVIQDLIECAQDVFCRDDLGEETKADIAQLFHEVLAEGGEIEAAYAAAAHLPASLT